MIIAEDSLATVALLPFRRDQGPRIYLEMPERVIGDIFRGPASAHPAIMAK